MADEVSTFGTVALDQLPDDLRERIGAIAEKSGFVPNVFLVLARRPDEFRAFFAYHDALMLKESGLSNRMANLTGMRPNDEFYLMGRLPREKK